MSQSPEIRARQHLLLQGFTLYTAEAADGHWTSRAMLGPWSCRTTSCSVTSQARS
jgi:hypothetical protein